MQGRKYGPTQQTLSYVISYCHAIAIYPQYTFYCHNCTMATPATTSHILHHNLTQCKAWGKESCWEQKSSNNDLTFYFKIACFCLSPNMSIINDPNIFQINIATKNNLLSISRTYLLFSLYLQFYILAKQPATLHSTHEYWIFIPLLSMIV